MASSVVSLFTFATYKSVGGGGGCVRDVLSGWPLRILHCHVHKKGSGLAILHVLILQLVGDELTSVSKQSAMCG